MKLSFIMTISILVTIASFYPLCAEKTICNSDNPVIIAQQKEINSSDVQVYAKSNQMDSYNPTPQKAEIHFGLAISPQKETYSRGDLITLSWDLETPSVPVRCDIYLVILDIWNRLYFAPKWNLNPAPVVPDFVLPKDWIIENSPIMFFPIPCSKPPIGYMGTYTFAIGAAEPGTLNFVSNIAAVSFEIK